jgi:hypothetical protein
MHPSGDFDQAMARLAPAGQAGDIQTLAMNPVGFADPAAAPSGSTATTGVATSR